MSWQTSKSENGRSPVYTPSCWRLERVRTYLLRIALVSLKPCSTHRPFTYFQYWHSFSTYILYIQYLHSFHWGHSRHGDLKWLAHTVEQNYQSPKHLWCQILSQFTDLSPELCFCSPILALSISYHSALISTDSY